MLTFYDGYRRTCQGVTRRAVLQAGALGGLGWSLADLLRAEESQGIQGSRKSIIHVHLDGGPPQMDLIDPKPNGPAEVRGEFQPISTATPGIAVTELLPRLAAISEDLVFLRSLVGAEGQHDAFQCQSGYGAKDLQGLGGRPAQGCVLNKLWARPNDDAPLFVDLMQGRPLVRDSARPGFLGPSFQAFRPDISTMFQRELEPGMKTELARQGANHSTSLQLNAALEAGRLRDRRALLRRLDHFNRASDAAGMMLAADRFQQQAASMLTSGRFARAMQWEREDPATLAMYEAPAQGEPNSTSDSPLAARKFLLARRMIEAGVRCVSISISDFDTHAKNAARLRSIVPIVDHGLSALVRDLKQRGMLDDVTIVAWGEFGRTPKINAKAGRDHWPRVGMALLAGGGMPGGQTIGATDNYAATAVARPVTYQDVFASLYRNLGLDATRTTLIDPSGRPRYLVESGRVIAELHA